VIYSFPQLYLLSGILRIFKFSYKASSGSILFLTDSHSKMLSTLNLIKSPDSEALQNH